MRTSSHRWHRSLYWRAAASLVLLVSGLVAAQAVMAWWLFSRNVTEPTDPRNETFAAASRLSSALSSDPTLQPADALREIDERGELFVVMRDGRVAGAEIPDAMAQQILRNVRTANSPGGPGSWRASGYRAAAIIVDRHLEGVVGLERPTPFEANQTAAISGSVALLVCGVVTGLLVFGPTSRRLSQLAAAVRRLGSGDLSARAPERGNDEVTEVAAAFNAMATTLAQHAHDREAADRARRQLVADVSHELMTPLTAIRGYLETLAMSGIQMAPETRQQQVAIARRETQRLERLIGDLLETARLEAGGGHLELSDLRVEDLFQRVVEHYTQEYGTRCIHCKGIVLPGAETVTADHFRIEQALLNVTGNAFRHTPDNGSVLLRAEQVDAAIVLSVTDTGEGIPATHLPLIFDRFYKVPSSRVHPHGGTGLGLAIVRAIVERHGGHVSATSEMGKGTTISLVFPTNQPAASQRRARLG